MKVHDATSRADLLAAVHASGQAVHRSGHPAMRAAAHRALADEALLSSTPGDTVGEMRALSREARARHQRGVWTFAAAGIGLVAAAGTVSALGGPVALALAGMVGGVGCLVRGGLGTDRVSAEDYRMGVLDRWVRQLNGGPADSAVAGSAAPAPMGPPPATDRGALVGMLESLDSRLAQQAEHPVVGAALGVVRSDLARLRSAPGSTLAEMRTMAASGHASVARAHKRYLAAGIAAWAAGGGAMLALGGPVGIAGAAAVGAFAAGCALVIKAGLTQDRLPDQGRLEDALARWEPQLDSWRRLQEAPDEVARLAAGAPAPGEIEVRPDGVRIGSVFVPAKG